MSYDITDLTKRTNHPGRLLCLNMEDYTSKSKIADNQQDIILRRRQKAIAVYEKDTVSTIEAGQRLHAKRFLDRLKKSETLLKEHDSTKTMLFTRRHELHRDERAVSRTEDEMEDPKNVEGDQESRNEEEVTRNATGVLQKRRENRTSRKFQEQELATRRASRSNAGEKNANRVFSAKLREMNNSIDVPYVKLCSYTRADLRRPATSLELKRKVWEDMTNHLEQSHLLRPSSRAEFAERCAKNVPRSVQEAREKLWAFTKLRFSSQLPSSPPRIDVERVQDQHRELQGIERTVVRQFCDSLGPLRTVLPESFRLMDVNEVHRKNAEIQGLIQRRIHDPRHGNEREKRDRAIIWLKDIDVVATKHQDYRSEDIHFRLATDYQPLTKT